MYLFYKIMSDHVINLVIRTTYCSRIHWIEGKVNQHKIAEKKETMDFRLYWYLENYKHAILFVRYFIIS